jgi:hypothetical protein
MQLCSQLVAAYLGLNDGHYVVCLLEVAADMDACQFSIQGILSDFCWIHILVLDVFFINEVEV